MKVNDKVKFIPGASNRGQSQVIWTVKDLMHEHPSLGGRDFVTIVGQVGSRRITRLAYVPSLVLVRNEPTMAVVHASDSRGVKRCGNQASGDARANVAKYPERWEQVTCPGCLETR